ncbi:MAG: hypothetical protein HY564_02550 [Candidatus Jacksonbacteria bacterium]|nr:hypothetical protein [Candidatus Jacksonbacteria bacterium]
MFSPEETKRAGTLCPKCRKPLTLGVEYRVHCLAGRTIDEARAYGELHRPPFKKIVPLSEIIRNVFGAKSETKKAREEYNKLIDESKNEYAILMEVSIDELLDLTLPEIAEGIQRVRDGRIHIEPGYDGVYGTVRVYNDTDRAKFRGAQAAMF